MADDPNKPSKPDNSDPFGIGAIGNSWDQPDATPADKSSKKRGPRKATQPVKVPDLKTKDNAIKSQVEGLDSSVQSIGAQFKKAVEDRVSTEQDSTDIAVLKQAVSSDLTNIKSIVTGHATAIKNIINQNAANYNKIEATMKDFNVALADIRKKISSVERNAGSGSGRAIKPVAAKKSGSGSFDGQSDRKGLLESIGYLGGLGFSLYYNNFGKIKDTVLGPDLSKKTSSAWQDVMKGLDAKSKGTTYDKPKNTDSESFMESARKRVYEIGKNLNQSLTEGYKGNKDFDVDVPNIINGGSTPKERSPVTPNSYSPARPQQDSNLWSPSGPAAKAAAAQSAANPTAPKKPLTRGSAARPMMIGSGILNKVLGSSGADPNDFDTQYFRAKIDEQKAQFMKFGQLPQGFEFLQGHMGTLGNPAAVAATGAQPIGYSDGGGYNYPGAWNPSSNGPSAPYRGGGNGQPGYPDQRISQNPAVTARQQLEKDAFVQPKVTGNIDRSNFNEQMADPAVRSAIIARARIEVGDNPDAQKNFMEEVFNRAAARKMSLIDVVSNKDGYYPHKDDDRWNKTQGNAATDAEHAALKDVHENGRNVTRGATGNASGTVGFNGGPQTYKDPLTGERYGIEGQDRKWKPDYIKADATGAEGWRDLPPMAKAARDQKITDSLGSPNAVGAYSRVEQNAGATGIGAAEGYMGPKSIHVGYGDEGTWGAGGRFKSSPKWLQEAFAKGQERSKGFQYPDATANNVTQLSGQEALKSAMATPGNPISKMLGRDKKTDLYSHSDESPYGYHTTSFQPDVAKKIGMRGPGSDDLGPRDPMLERYGEANLKPGTKYYNEYMEKQFAASNKPYTHIDNIDAVWNQDKGAASDLIKMAAAHGKPIWVSNLSPEMIKQFSGLKDDKGNPIYVNGLIEHGGIKPEDFKQIQANDEYAKNLKMKWISTSSDGTTDAEKSDMAKVIKTIPGASMETSQTTGSGSSVMEYQNPKRVATGPESTAPSADTKAAEPASDAKAASTEGQTKVEDLPLQEQPVATPVATETKAPPAPPAYKPTEAPDTDADTKPAEKKEEKTTQNETASASTPKPEAQPSRDAPNMRFNPESQKESPGSAGMGSYGRCFV